MAGLGDLDDLLSELEAPVDRSSSSSSSDDDGGPNPSSMGMDDLDDLLGELDDAGAVLDAAVDKSSSKSSSSSEDVSPDEPIWSTPEPQAPESPESSSSEEVEVARPPSPPKNDQPKSAPPPAATAVAVNELDDLLGSLEFASNTPAPSYSAPSKKSSSSSSSSSDDDNNNNNNNFNSTPAVAPVVKQQQPVQVVQQQPRSYGGSGVSMSGDEMELLKEINTARENPMIYANILNRDVKPNFDGMVYKNKRPEATYAVTTNEGVRAVDEAISFLQSARPVPPLQSASGLLQAARAAVNKIGQAATTGTYALEVIDQYGTYSGSAGEVVVYGGHTAQEFVIDMIVCDGDPSRQYRNHIMDKDRKFVGISSGPHNGPFKTMCCVVLSEGWSDK